MAEEGSLFNVVVVWRGKLFDVKMNKNSTIKEFGQKLQILTNVKPDTMRLLIPKSTNKGSKLLTPFSDGDSSLSLQEVGISEGKSIRMMGVFNEEIEEILQNSTKDLRIAGFEEEEKRLKQRLKDRPHSLKLPQGTYIFCDFRPLQIPGVKLNPPASEALKRMHMLASDPGIIAIMNKHRWRVGIMTEMAPEGYVGISPICILGFNKNHGEEISLRLRTDDLKGFRKYESIKKTLLHELAHMVYSEHDANFHALDKQLNEEAISLDWRKSRSYTLSNCYKNYLEEDYDFDAETGNSAQKLGGKSISSLIDARSASISAAYHRMLNRPANNSSVGANFRAENIIRDGEIAPIELDPDDCEAANETFNKQNWLRSNSDEHTKEDVVDEASTNIHGKPCISSNDKESKEPDPDDFLKVNDIFEPDPDDSHVGEADSKPFLRNAKFHDPNTSEKLDPNDCEGVEMAEGEKANEEPDPDDCKEERAIMEDGNFVSLDPALRPDNSVLVSTVEDDIMINPSAPTYKVEDTNPTWEQMQTDEPDPDDAKMNNVMLIDNINSFDKSDSSDNLQMVLETQSEELQRIGGSTAVICNRLQKAIDVLQSEVTPTEAKSVLQTLFKIIRNVIEHPDEAKFRRLRKANPLFQKNIANYKAAMEVLYVVGFHEDTVWDEIGRVETYMILKWNDPGLLWLAKSSLEMRIA